LDVTRTITGNVLPSSSSPLKISCDGDCTSLTFTGNLDDVRVYNYALTAPQVQTLYNENAAVRFGPLIGAP
jgi:hypothetical protein